MKLVYAGSWQPTHFCPTACRECFCDQSWHPVQPTASAMALGSTLTPSGLT